MLKFVRKMDNIEKTEMLCVINYARQKMKIKIRLSYLSTEGQ